MTYINKKTTPLRQAFDWIYQEQYELYDCDFISAEDDVDEET
jgi:hypothetical protein